MLEDWVALDRGAGTRKETEERTLEVAALSPKLRHAAGALLGYALLTMAYTWPLTFHINDVVPSDLGDPLLSTWTLWWNAHVLPFSDRWWEGLGFYPARHSLTFSDHRVGIGLIATPAIWLGASPLAAHNVAFLLSFFLSAVAAYVLCSAVTRSRKAAFIGGLIFGFHPFRADHLAHLELLSSYWLPVVLLSLHRWAATLKPAWLALTAVAMIMQALTSGYYFIFSGVLLGLWLVWFTPRSLGIKQCIELGMALIIPVLAIAPVLLKYRQAHTTLGLSRQILEIEHYSADAIGLLTAPRLLALWNTPATWQRTEGALLPGAMAVLLIAGALWVRRSSDPRPTLAWLRRVRLAALAAAAVMALVAAVPYLFGPVAYEIAGVRVSVSHPYKPTSLATFFFAAWFLTAARVRTAWSDRSPFAFYTLATLAMWLLALGPTARLFGERVLYKAPYAWLMILPGFNNGFRVPARFGMLAALTLSVAAALAFWRLTSGRSARVQLAAVYLASAAIVAESWIEPLPMFPAPRALMIPAGVPADAVILELPLGVFEDAAAVYRSIAHQRRTVNGFSGYDAPHYAALRAALEEGRLEVLDEFAAYAPVAIFVARDARGVELSTLLATRTKARALGGTETHDVLLLAHRPGAPASMPGRYEMRRVHELSSVPSPEDLPRMEDGNRMTAWMPGGSQNGTEQFTADLGEPVDVSGIVLAQGSSTTEFPRTIVVDVSADGITWRQVWRGDTAAKTVAAAIEDPREIRVLFPFASQPARYVRVRQVGQSKTPWAVAEFRVAGPPG